MHRGSKLKVLIFIVAYNAESHIESVLRRIPEEIKNRKNYEPEVLIIDDASKDKTTELSNKYRFENNDLRLEILKTPVNQGYGGNQKIGFHYAIQNDFDVVALLHGDGQYAPECLPHSIEPIVKGEADVVFGSRMLKKRAALKGGMPLYKFIDNIILTKIQNCLLKSHLSEFHSGYRVYSVKALKSIPFQYNSNGFDFDTDIIIQLIDNEFTIREIPIPTYYGDEICHVNGLKYAKNVIKTTILSRLQRKLFIYYNQKFDYIKDNRVYTSKVGFHSSHQFAIDQVKNDSVVLDIGCGPGYIAKELRRKNCRVYGIDQYIQAEAIPEYYHTQETDLDDCNIEFDEKRLDIILILDTIEHLESPEGLLISLREKFSRFRPRVVITTGNIAFIIQRFSLLIGNFNYGKKGILDLTHKRLFTFNSLKRTFLNCGYTIEHISGIPVPFPLVFGKNLFSSLLLVLNNLLIKISRGMFSYQIAIVARPTPTLDDLLKDAIRTGLEEKELFLEKRYNHDSGDAGS